ncbi:MobB relaxase/mobilization protein [Escherichia coli]|nr:MobB relaxase/mobilization protein [Escherichia coli]
MLIRCKGYNSGVKEYLEEGQKSGRALSRDEIDERVILDGNLELTELIYKSIPDKGQDRYLTFTLSFKEDEVGQENLSAITQEFKSFLMTAYESDEFNFYAEAHLPKIKTMEDKKTGELLDRKPHIHIVIPRKNLLTGNEMNPVGSYKQNEKYLEAFQEYINQKYRLESPRDNIRATPTSYADMLSRYKGDDFRAKNKQFKVDLLEQVFKEDVRSRKEFYDLVSKYGETRIRNAGKPSEYIAVMIDGDKKYTNLKETIFSDDFIVHRKISKPPLEKQIISNRFSEWRQRAAEIKYMDKIASPTYRNRYYASESSERSKMILEFTNRFYEKYRGHDELRNQRQRNNKQRSPESQRGIAPAFTDSLQNLPNGYVASTQSGQGNKELLPGNARLHLANQQTNGNSGLRRSVRGTRGGGGTSSDPKQQRSAGTPSNGNFLRTVERHARRRTKLQLTPYPVLPRLKNRIPTLEDVKRRGGFLLNAGEIKNGKISVKSPSQARDVNVNTSSVPGWLIRRVKETESPEKNINKLLRSVDREFYDIKREVLDDKRFTYQEKKQLLSVMHFERLKRKDIIINKKEGFSMGSKDIRQMMSNNRKNLSGFTISAPEPEKEQPAESRFTRIMDKLRNPVHYSKVADDSRKAVEHRLDASNLYTKRTRKGHVHYLDKTSDKTLFVDNGQLITMRKNGLSKDSVAVALELAQGRFGSTLNIKGSKQFKEMVINVVAERGMDIHFTDKRMNEALQLRRQELEQAKEQRDSSNRDSAFTIGGAELEKDRESGAELPKDRESTTSEELPEKAVSASQDVDSDNAPLYRSVSTLQGKIVKHGEAPYLDKQGNSQSYYVTLKGKDGQETTQWGVGLKDALKGFRRGHEISLELKESKPVQVRVRDENGHYSTREAVRNVWEATRLNGPQPKNPGQQKDAELYKGFQVVNDAPTPDLN